MSHKERPAYLKAVKAEIGVYVDYLDTCANVGVEPTCSHGKRWGGCCAMPNSKSNKPKECEYCGGEEGVRLFSFLSPSDPPALLCIDCQIEAEERADRN